MAIAEYGTLDALGLADLVRRRQVSPAELLEEAIGRNERVNPKLGAVITTLYDDARRVAGAPGQVACRRPRRRLFRRRAVSGQGHLLRHGGRSGDEQQPLPRRLQAGARRDDRRALPQGRPRHLRPHQRARARSPAGHRTRASRTDQEPLGSGAHPGRLERRLGRCRRGRDRPARARQRRRRLDPHPRLLLRPLRPEADACAHTGRSGALAALERVHHRARGFAQRPRQRGAARRHRRARGDLTLLGAADDASVSRGGGRVAGPTADRAHQAAAGDLRRASSRLRRGRRRHRPAARRARPSGRGGRSRRRRRGVRARLLHPRLRRDRGFSRARGDGPRPPGSTSRAGERHRHHRAARPAALGRRGGARARTSGGDRAQGADLLRALRPLVVADAGAAATGHWARSTRGGWRRSGRSCCSDCTSDSCCASRASSTPRFGGCSRSSRSRRWRT